MGVVHKLREDIVSFIITLKRNNPSIGVRQLAVLTSEQFHIKVSKSSVNNVLKKESLSSSVGRRPGLPAQPEKFSIPANKKDQISKSIQKAGFLTEAPCLQEKEEKIQKTESPPKKKPLEQTQLQEEQKISLPPDVSPKKEGTPGQPPPAKKEEEKVSPEIEPSDRPDFSAYVEAMRGEKKGQEKVMSNGAGFIFLKAAQWEIGEHSLMAELFKKNIKFMVSDHFDSASDMFLFAKFLGVESFEHIASYRGHGLWILNNFCSPSANEKRDMIELQELFRWDAAMQESLSRESLIMEYGRIKEQAFFEVKGFKLLLEDRSELIMDASMVSFGGGGTLSFSCSASPVQKAMARLSNCLVSNVQSAVFHRIPGETRFDRAFYDMVAVFENIRGKRIFEISAFDLQGEEVARFSTVPFQKRNFLMGVSPQQKEFGEITKTAKWAKKKALYHKGTDRIFLFSETKTNFIKAQTNEKIGEIRIITVWEDKGVAPCWGILTNQIKGSGEDILNAYLSQWPYLGEDLQTEPVFVPPSDQNQGEDKKQERSIFIDFVEALHGYCQRHFFAPPYAKIGITQLITDIYDIPGNCYETQNSISVRFNVEKESAYYKDLVYAARKVNERHILDYLGRRLWLES